MNDMIRKEAQLVWEQLDEVSAKTANSPKAQREIELIAEAIQVGERRGQEAGKRYYEGFYEEVRTHVNVASLTKLPQCKTCLELLRMLDDVEATT